MKDTELNLRELDAWIAEHVKGYRIRKSKSSIRFEEIEMPLSDGSTKWCGLNLIEKYTTDPSASDDLDDKIIERLSENLEGYSVRKNADGNYVFRAIYKGEEFAEYNLNKKICRALFAKKLFTKHP